EDLIFNLIYSKNQGSKVEKTDENGNPILTMIKKNTKSKGIYFDYSKYNGGDYIFIDNQIQGGKPEKDLDKYVFHPDHPSIKELLAKKHLQVQNRRSDKEYQIFYLERDIEKQVSAGNSTTYYFNNEAKVRTAVLQNEGNFYLLESEKNILLLATGKDYSLVGSQEQQI
ncbi:21240_t:CDS:2, partial [Racocetra persica]